MLLGYMHYRKSPVNLNRAYAFAATAMAEGVELLYFSPGAVDFEKKVINGYKYSDGEWEKTLSLYPDVIYNTSSFFRDKQAKTVDILRQQIPFTSYSIGSKITVYQNLMKYKLYADYLVPSKKILSIENFFTYLNRYLEIVLKPSCGHQGKGIYYIKKEGTEFKTMFGAEESKQNFEQIDVFLRDKIRHEDYIIQPYVNCRTKAGIPYDIRLHVQKGHHGEWVAPVIYPRISSNGSIVCNIGQGGYTTEIAGFLKGEFSKRYLDIQKYIEIFSLQFAVHMDKIQKELYNEELDELGIDIGLDNNQKIFIYEVNWRPGHPPFTNINLSVVKNTIRYAKYLAERKF